MKNWPGRENCSICKYWQDLNGIMSEQGACHRYPQAALVKTYFDWCGEFKEVGPKEASERKTREREYELRVKRRADTQPVDE